MKFDPLRWVFRSIISISNKIEAIVDAIPCRFGRHDYQVIPPDNFNIHYEQLDCTCGLIFRGLAHIRQHLKYGAPACKFNRVCLKCEHIDLRLDREMQDIVEQIIIEETEETRAQKAKRIMQEYNAIKANQTN